MTGYRPDLEFLESLGIRLDPESQKPRTNPETLESDRPGIFLAGVIVAGMHTNEIFIENGRFHGKQIAEAIADSLAPSSVDIIERHDHATRLRQASQLAAAAALPAFAAIDSKFSGVMIGAQTYSFRTLPTLDDCIAAMKEIGLGYAELWDGQIVPKDRSAGRSLALESAHG